MAFPDRETFTKLARTPPCRAGVAHDAGRPHDAAGGVHAPVRGRRSTVGAGSCWSRWTTGVGGAAGRSSVVIPRSSWSPGAAGSRSAEPFRPTCRPTGACSSRSTPCWSTTGRRPKPTWAPRATELPPLHSGVIGYLGYDVVREVEHLPDVPVDDRSWPDAVLSVIGELAAYDHWNQQVTLVVERVRGRRCRRRRARPGLRRGDRADRCHGGRRRDADRRAARRGPRARRGAARSCRRCPPACTRPRSRWPRSTSSPATSSRSCSPSASTSTCGPIRSTCTACCVRSTRARTCTTCARTS